MVDHRAQLMLYSLLMSERYELPIRTGLLLYLHTGQTLVTLPDSASPTALVAPYAHL